MRNPAYLSLSRHGVFYFRYPLQPRFAAVVRFSLHTRDPKEALALSRELVLVATSVLTNLRQADMSLDEIRALLATSFASYRATHREAALANGPRREEELETHEHYISLFDQGKVKRSVVELAFDSFLVDKGLSLSKEAPHYAQAASEHGLASRDFRQYVVDYNRSLKDGAAAPRTATVGPGAVAAPRHTLRAVLDAYASEMVLEKRGTAKTQKRRARHMAFLCEVLGGEADLSKIGFPESRKVKATLTALPPHRTKKVETRGKTLEQLLEAPAEATLHVRTINSHLTTYAGFFRWAKQNGYVTETPFLGLAYNAQNANDDDPRVPFTMDQLVRIRDAVLAPSRAVLPHHKWGTLIGMHLGARVNEIAQLHLSDIIQRDAIWCFDINANDKAATKKQLKNKQSARVVPIHPFLLSIGFLGYVQEQRSNGETRLFPDFTHTVDGGYGRSLSRWFNETLLPSLELKTKQHVFHSLRHSMVQQLFAAEVTEAHVMAIVGHEPGTTTLKVYNRNGFPPEQLLSDLSKVVITESTDTDSAASLVQSPTPV